MLVFCYVAYPMAISRDIQQLISKGDFDAIEDDWLTHSAEHPDDLNYFVGLARALVGTGEDERARFLLQLLVEQLRERELWRVHLVLQRRAGNLLLADAEELHASILETLGRLYGDHTGFEGLVEAVGLQRAPQDIPKTWEKVERLETLIPFDVGAVVRMENRGVGRIAEINFGLESFKVDFARFPGLSIGFRAAPKVLEPLSRDHVLRRKLEEPEALRKLVADDPSELLHAVLTSYDRPLTAAEIRDALTGVVSEKQWTTWWAAARKHPQVVASGRGRQTYSWVESSADALEAIWQEFERAAPRKQIELLRREGGRDEALHQRMARKLSEVGGEADPGLAFEIWFALERSGGAPEGVPWDPEELLATVEPGRLFAGIEDRLLRERGYTMLRERREDWLPVYLELLGQEEDPRALDVLGEAVRRESPKDFERLVDGLLAQPHRTPAAFVWLAERAAEDDELRSRNPLRLLQQILTAQSRDEFSALRNRFKPLVESGGTLPRLLGHLDADQAPQTEDAIRRANGLETYQREQLLAALHLRHPHLREEEEPLYATPEAISAKRAELKEIVSKELPANRKAIEEARALGDLRENFEYKSARQRHEYLSARAAELDNQLARVMPIAEAGGDGKEARIGSRVRLRDEAGNERVFTLLGPWESDPERDVISYQSDLGRTLVGKKPGEAVEVAGTAYTVERIESR